MQTLKQGVAAIAMVASVGLIVPASFSGLALEPVAIPLLDTAVFGAEMYRSHTNDPAAQLVAMVAGGANGEPGWAVSACRVFACHGTWEESRNG